MLRLSFFFQRLHKSDDHWRRNGIQLPGADFRNDVFLQSKPFISVTEDSALLFCAPELECIADGKRTCRLNFEFSLFLTDDGPGLQQGYFRPVTNCQICNAAVSRKPKNPRFHSGRLDSERESGRVCYLIAL